MMSIEMTRVELTKISCICVHRINQTKHQKRDEKSAENYNMYAQEQLINEKKKKKKRQKKTKWQGEMMMMITRLLKNHEFRNKIAHIECIAK